MYRCLWASLVTQWYRICLQCRRHRFNPWVGKIPWRRAWQLIPVFLIGESHGQRSLADYMGSQRVRHNWSDLAGMHRCLHIFKRWWLLSTVPQKQIEVVKVKWSRPVVPDPQRPHGLQPTRLLCPWDSPGRSTGVGRHRLLQDRNR